MDTNSATVRGSALRIRIYAGLLLKLSGRARVESLSRHLPGITGLQVGVMQTLMVQSVTLKDLAERMMIRPATLVPVVEKLVRASLIVRKLLENDRRSALLEVTTDGRRLLAKADRVEEEDALLIVASGMGVRKAELLVSLLAEAVEALAPGKELVASVESTLGRRDPGRRIRRPKDGK